MSAVTRWSTVTRSRRVTGGFTLVELLVILVIIGVLAALIVPNVIGRADESRVTAARADVGNLMQALKLYRLDNQRYPSQEQGLQALVQRPTSGPPAALPPPTGVPTSTNCPTTRGTARTNT